MSGQRTLCLVIILGALVTYVAVLGVRPLVTPDEFRYAEIPREMLATGEWTVPHLDGFVYFEKPPLGYWATALSIRVFGETRFAVRLPFALATLMTGLIIYALMRRSLPDRSAAVMASGVFLSCSLALAVGTFAVLDALLTFFMTAMLAAFFLAAEHPPGWRRHGWLALCGAACGAGFLTKGFLIFAIPAVVVPPWLLWTSRWKEVLTLPWAPLLVAAAVAAPWCIRIAQRDDEFWHYFFIVEHWNRFAGGADAQHVRPWWFYLPILFLGGLPWTFLVPISMTHARRVKESRLLRFAVCWLVGPAVLFSIADGKLPAYVLPCFVPMALLLGSWIAACADPAVAARHTSRLARGMAVTLFVLAAALAAQSFAGWPGLDGVYVQDETYKWIIAVAALSLAGCAAWIGANGRRASRAATGMVAGMFVLFSAAPFLAPSMHGAKTPASWIRDVAGAIPDDTILVADGTMVHAVCWCLKRSDVLLLHNYGEFGYGVGRQPERFITTSNLADLVRDPRRRRPVVVLVRDPEIANARNIEPDSVATWRRMTMLRWE